ncbi:hypothetical protein [Pseudooceanicola onchidii]|uniref:hypothetical protein n=1 Tax=Pseudooceanicola onchidii TaxID=2562279 RepID=UPI0010AB323A|nr:hypothetical protein [Pseudooceanicola onchidii]
MYELPETPDLLIAAGTLLAGAAAMWGAHTAHKGLDSWRRDKDSDFARELAKELFRYRSSLHAIRSPGLTYAERETTDLKQSHYETFRRVLFERWRYSMGSRDLLETLVLEAELRWKSHPLEAFKPIRAVSDKIINLIIQYSILQGQIDRESEVLSKGNTEVSDKLDLLWEKLSGVEAQLFDDLEETNAIRWEIDDAFQDFKALLMRKI